MRFLSPTIDIVFKKLFGDQQRTGITISFLNAVLERREGNLITQLTINPDANLPESAEDKVSFVDVRCTDQTGKQYIIEMQVALQKDFLQRAQYYKAAGLYAQLKQKEWYGKLMPVIFVGVLDFTLFPDKDSYLSHHGIVDLADGQRSLQHLEYHFLELPKFNKSLDQLITETEKWAYFIKEADSLGAIPRQLKSEAQFDQAFHVLERAGWTSAELRAYEAEIDRLRCEGSQRETARELGLEEGRQAGLEEGRQVGLQEGRKDGMRIAAEEIALKLLDLGKSLVEIAELTGLTTERLKELKDKKS